MENNINKCIEHLNNGLKLKREGNFSGALNEYYLARKQSITYKQTYNNIAKILLKDSGTIEDALLNFLTYAHLTILQDDLIPDNINFAYHNNLYDYDDFFMNNKYMSGETTYERVLEEIELGKIFSDVNLTFNTGFAYLLLHSEITNYNKIPIELIFNQKKLLLGQEFVGETLVASKFSTLIRNIGFQFLVENMIIKDYGSEDYVSTIYFSENYQMDDI